MNQGFASGLYTDPNGDPANGSTADQQARLLHYQDLIKVGLAGNLAGLRVRRPDRHAGDGRRGRLQRLSRPATPSDPSEAITYVDAHDNETLYDALAYKLPHGTTARGPGPGAGRRAAARSRWARARRSSTAGTDLLRSKSLDRNSYNSGDWFNRMDWSGLRRRQRLRRGPAAGRPTTRPSGRTPPTR